MNRPKYLTMGNYNPKYYTGEINDGISQTIPDQTMSVKTLLLRHKRGQQLPLEKTPVYHYNGDGKYPADLENLPDVEKLNKMEKIQLAREMRDANLEHQKHIQKQQNKLSQKQKEESDRAASEAATLLEDAAKVTPSETHNGSPNL